MRLNHCGNGVRMALVGLLAVAAVSGAAGPGRKPAKEQGATASLRRLSGSEVMDILNKFPEMVPSYLASSKNDTSGLVDIFGFIEVTSPELARVFPAARFYICHDFWQPPQPYMMAVAGEKRYMLGDFNQLVLDNGLEVDDKRIIELAEAFVVFAVGSAMGSIPEVTFPESKRVNQVINGTPFKVMLKVEIDGQVDDWYFRVIGTQFSYVSRRGAKGIVKHYLPNVVEPLPSRGQLDPTPDSVMEVPRMTAAQAERDSLGTGLASGSETEEGQEVKVSLRRLPTSEVMTILDKFPEMVASYLAYLKGSEALASVYPLSEVTAAPLKRAFPNVRFFKGLDFGIHPPIPYVMATAGRKRYPMPAGLNQLLSDSDVKVTDANLVEIAKAAVILALGNDMLGNPFDGGYVSDELLAFPKITSLSAEMQVTGDSHAAKLRVRIGDSEESWYVHRWHDQLGWVSRENANGLIKDYDMPQARPREQQK